MRIGLTAFLLVILIRASGQEAFNASGGDVNSSSGSLNYSIGQIFYQTDYGSTSFQVQGVQQPYDISVVTGLENPNIELKFSAYPNPTHDYLNIIFKSDEQLKDCEIKILDIKGTIKLQTNVTEPETQIDMSEYPTGTYILSIISENKNINTYKIIKK